MIRRRIPWAARGILRLTLPDDWRDDIVRDLEEAYEERWASGGRWVAGIWLTWQLVVFPSRFLMDRLRGGSSVRPERRTAGWNILREGCLSAMRTAKRYPGFTAGVIITLGLGIGANATMYGIVDRLLLQPPAHVVDHERVQRMFMEHRSLVGTGELVMNPRTSYLDYEDLKSHEGLAAVAAYRRSSVLTVGNGESARPANVVYASGEFFPLLGVSPLRGRFYTAEESAPGSPLTVVLSAEHWTSVYGADPGVLGRTIEVGGRAHTIIGVAPPGFTGIELGKVDLWLPYEATFEALGIGSFNSRSCCSMRVVVRLKDAVSVEAAEAEATGLLLNARRGAPEGPRNNITRIVFGPLIAAQGPEPSAAQAGGESRVAESLVARWLVGVSLIVLLIACANVANLLMARGTRQRKEVAVRIALGAARGRVVGQMMVESVLLALAGGLLALMLARWGGGIVRSTLLPDVYFPNSALTARLFVFTVVAALVAGVTAGIVPALHGEPCRHHGRPRRGFPRQFGRSLEAPRVPHDRPGRDVRGAARRCRTFRAKPGRGPVARSRPRRRPVTPGLARRPYPHPDGGGSGAIRRGNPARLGATGCSLCRCDVETVVSGPKPALAHQRTRDRFDSPTARRWPISLRGIARVLRDGRRGDHSRTSVRGLGPWRRRESGRRERDDGPHPLARPRRAG